jgi:hypothetical protein
MPELSPTTKDWKMIIVGVELPNANFPGGKNVEAHHKR